MQRDIVRRGKLSCFGSVSGKATAGERQHREIWMSVARARIGRRGQRRGGDRHPIVPVCVVCVYLLGRRGGAFAARRAAGRGLAPPCSAGFLGARARAQLSGRSVYSMQLDRGRYDKKQEAL